MYRIHLFLDETGRILNEKMMPDVTILATELEGVKKHIEYQYVNEPVFHMFLYVCMWWNKKLPDLAPTNPPIPYVFLRNSRGQAPTWEFLQRLLACTTT
jgi:hypothetical protein